MNNKKPWWRSRTIQSSIISAVTGVLTIISLELQWGSEITTAAIGIGTSMLAIIFRKAATSTIGKEKS
tara:strand:- start:9064 stop:9267 length:204 start_codon:yes stop_codon:yes gene_type:complete